MAEIIRMPKLSDTLYDALIKSAAKQITADKAETAILNQEVETFTGVVAGNEANAQAAA